MAWFVGAELSTASTRARIQGLSVSAQYVFCFISPLIYYPFEVSPSSKIIHGKAQGLVGPLSFLLFIAPLTLIAFYMYLRLPETKQKTSEEIRLALLRSSPRSEHF